MSFKAVELYDQAIAANEGKVEDIRKQRDVVWRTGRSVRSKSIHFLETLAAQDARNVQNDPAQFALVTKRLEALLIKDVANQAGAAGVTQKLAEFQRDPKAWIAANVNPRTYESDAAVDWSKWVPPAKAVEK